MAKRPDTLRIAIAQLNPTMGDIAGNLELAREARADAARGHADLVFFTELFISGYPPEDLVRKPAFLRDCMAAVEELAKETADGGPGVVIGSPYAEEGKVYNAVAVLDDGKVQTWRLKGHANLLVFPNLDAANITLSVAKQMTDGLQVGPILLGTAKAAHVLTPAITSRGVFNMSAIAAVDAIHHQEG